jgi:fido (protein-threonine AMPylation protein)
MTAPLFDGDDEASTPLTPQERADLIPAYITRRVELNAAEQLGVDDADAWAFSRKREALSEAFLCQLHRRMFSGIWKWAGDFRDTEHNIRVAPWRSVKGCPRSRCGETIRSRFAAGC